MPITPFHFGPGAAIHAAAPRCVSFLAFCAANMLIDFEPLYYLLTGHPDIRPFAPFSDSNPMLLAVTVRILHWSCLAAGLAGVCVLAIRNLIRKAEAEAVARGPHRLSHYVNSFGPIDRDTTQAENSKNPLPALDANQRHTIREAAQ